MRVDVLTPALEEVPSINALDRFDTTGRWEPASWALWAVGISRIAGITTDIARRRPARARASEPAAAPAPRVTVIVPVLNEEARIGDQLDALGAVENLHQLIVVDGGSSDRTVDVARARGGLTVLTARRGRAPQMNAGADIATGDVFLFLHADVRLPEESFEDEEIARGGKTTAYVCERRVCSLPTSDPATFAKQIAGVKVVDKTVAEIRQSVP